MTLSAPIHVLKQQAKTLARQERLRLHQALDRIARREGFDSWSHLAAHWSPPDPSADLLSRLRLGDLVLLGARPGQGKTLLAIGLAIEAMTQGHHAAFFTLEFTAADVARCVARLQRDIRRFGERFVLDVSDRICADYVASRLASAPPGTLVVIDYLQLLDQRRGNASLAEQVPALKRLAVERQFVVVCLSQIDRRYDAAVKPYPDLSDVRLPNAADLSTFDKACFLGRGRMPLLTADRPSR